MCGGIPTHRLLLLPPLIRGLFHCHSLVPPLLQSYYTAESRLIAFFFFCAPTDQTLISLPLSCFCSSSSFFDCFQRDFLPLQQQVVVRAAHQMAGSVPMGSGQWNSGLCDCYKDRSSYICAWCCPCIVVGQLVEIIDQGVTPCLIGGAIYYLLQSLTGCGCLYTCGYRARLRAKYGLPPEPCGDYCVDCCCLHCSLAQQYRELSSRGVQPNLGWAANRTTYEQSAPPQQKMGAY